MSTAEVFRRIVESLGEDDLVLGHSIQGYDKSGFGVVLHAVEHMSYHTGQIILLIKQLVESDVGVEFYPHLAEQ